MPSKKLPSEKPWNIKKNKYNTIIEVVEKFEDLAPRMHELLTTSPEGTRIYLRVRDQKTVH